MITNVAALGPARFLAVAPAAPVPSPEVMARQVRDAADKMRALGYGAGHTEERMLALIADPHRREATRVALRHLEAP